jgi:hypothetical protein
MDGSHRRQLSAELIDGITEAVASTTDPRVRADVIADLVHEVDEAVKWRNERHPGGQEEQSLAALVIAAEVHRHRMDDVDEEVDDDDPATVTGQDFQTLSGRPAPARAVQD